MAAAKASRAKAAGLDLAAAGARVVSVFGPFQARVLIEMSADAAAALFPDGALGDAGRSQLLDAVQRDVEAIRKKDPVLADSALAASAMAMALEIEHPYNSATSKSMCQARLMDTLRELRELAPPEKKKDGVDEIKRRRESRLAARGTAAADLSGS